MYQHFILTRFNIILNNKLGFPSEEWQNTRLDIFEKTTLPSIKSQTRSKFKWIIYYDEQTSSDIMKRLKNYQKKYPFILQEMSGRMKGNPLSLKPITNNLSSITKYLITTRLDIDDALAKDFASAVYNQFNKQDFEFINFNCGVRKILGENIKCSVENWENNPFCSLIERLKPNRKIKTVNVCKHGHIQEFGKVKFIKNKNPLWMIIVHDNNVINRMMAKPIPNQNIFKLFNLKDANYGTTL